MLLNFLIYQLISEGGCARTIILDKSWAWYTYIGNRWMSLIGVNIYFLLSELNENIVILQFSSLSI